MKIYDEFHGETQINAIGKRLREIVKIEKRSFKVVTGHGSSTGVSRSKSAALRSLGKMKKEGLVKGFFPGDSVNISKKDQYYQDRQTFSGLVNGDKDYFNPGIIFVFV